MSQNLKLVASASTGDKVQLDLLFTYGWADNTHSLYVLHPFIACLSSRLLHVAVCVSRLQTLCVGTRMGVHVAATYKHGHAGRSRACQLNTCFMLCMCVLSCTFCRFNSKGLIDLHRVETVLPIEPPLLRETAAQQRRRAVTPAPQVMVNTQQQGAPTVTVQPDACQQE